MFSGHFCKNLLHCTTNNIKMITTNLIQELQWRGMIQDIMPGTEEQLNKEIPHAALEEKIAKQFARLDG